MLEEKKSGVEEVNRVVSYTFPCSFFTFVVPCLPLWGRGCAGAQCWSVAVVFSVIGPCCERSKSARESGYFVASRAWFDCRAG